MTASARRHLALLHRRRDQGTASTGRRGWRSAAGWCRRFRHRLPVVQPDRARDERSRRSWPSPGQALPPAVLLSYGYLAANSGQDRCGHQDDSFWKTVHEPRRGLGSLLRRRHRRRCDRAARRLHGQRPVVLGREPLLADREHPGCGPGARSRVSRACSGFLAPRFFSMGLIAAAFTTLISVSLTMTCCLSRTSCGRTGASRTDNRSFKIVFAHVDHAVPALVAPFWQLPALLKAILAMVGNLPMAPLAVADHPLLRQSGRASASSARMLGRNAVLGRHVPVCRWPSWSTDC